MADEQTSGVQTSEGAPAAVETPQVQDQVAQPTPENVPYARFEELNTQMNQMKEQLEGKDKANSDLLDQIAMYQANPGPAGQQAAAPAAQEPFTSDSLYDGLDDGDVLTVEESKAITKQMFNLLGSELMNLQFLVTHTDYTELCGTPDKPGKWIREAALKNPAILAEIRSSPNRMLTAYNHARAAKDAAGVQAQAPANKAPLSAAAQRAIDVSKTPGSPAGVGTGTGGLSKAQYYSTMSTEDLMKIADQVENRV